jgi:hypothetical protein
VDRRQALLWAAFALLLVAIVLAVIVVGMVRQAGRPAIAAPTWMVLLAEHPPLAGPD